ncbi:MAG: hypothetical protein A2X94_00990 [Bdellovibrionales bacterium GWB1_55_8]|nr:MAG: hypothetical protein A2X94_00990 [Bdellovibrionales bacterium GWB1_55_8]
MGPATYFRNFEGRVFFALVLVVTALFIWMTRAFLMPVFWAAVFAVLFQPAYRRTARMLRGRRAIAALLTIFAVIFVVLIPTALIVTSVARQALGLYQQIATGQIDLAAPVAFMQKFTPRLATALSEFGIELDQVREAIQSGAVTVTQWIAGQALAMGQNVAVNTIVFVLMLYFLFFFFRDGDQLVRVVIRALPIGDVRERRLFQKFAEVSRATVKGTLVVAAVQGAIGGVLFAIVGIQAPVFWAVIMGILSLLPAVGTGLIWLPAAVILIVGGELWKGIFLIAGGLLIIGLVDNVLRPILVGRETKMPDYLVLLATLGGVSMFGFSGFVVGPIITSFCLVMWEMFAEEYAP